jgi:hypothetical protein
MFIGYDVEEASASTMKHRLFQKFPARYQMRKERSILHHSNYRSFIPSRDVEEEEATGSQETNG